MRWEEVRWDRQQPTWPQARPALINAAAARAAARATGNWFVIGAARDVRPGRPFGTTVAGAEVVAWRDSAGRLLAGPGACPHLGAPLAGAAVCGGALVCPWHGLRLGGTGTAGWRPFPAYDDGLLAWVRLDAAGGERPAPEPAVPRRPAPPGALTAVYSVSGVCEPSDVVANRLDPWHGAWLHPYAFSDLTVLRTPDDGDEGFTVRVAYRVAGRLVVPVEAVFTAPGPRTVVMRITRGEGTGSVVETHATPLGAGRDGRPRTAVVEAVVATSHRPGFALARSAAPLLRPLIRAASARLWRDDLAYAERRWALRTRDGRRPERI
ncbi:DUF5914 domain-containing protein [Streptomyces sp. SL13]|uniref:DUF5914 domain-containing protein n=1 Tax=Streptantibioticus silvisoli TaxID=2705255 RepID=A0AA90H0E5_9ACTN|nr:DUF5914 domain-containing protein [Streptantibioticus silvisoli]MDI5964430.1 DUF5914 domain-containing protein [Streptantibioticus silvisoli]MDI5969076.1 DUF5914 domain-containing protein [Streptantibioticus silvisoli]